MARTVIPIQTLPKHGGIDNSLDWTAGDQNPNNMYFLGTGREIVLMRSTAAGARAATLVSVADASGRTGDGSFTPTGDTMVAAAGFLRPSDWNQSGADSGRVHIDITDDTSMEFAVLRIT
ncbi:MAG: hypothetical protein ACXADY_25920 [Candidatus Hodarchaeales archaeon]|jgi:hypothetical protein